MAISKIKIKEIGEITLSRRKGLKNIRLSVSQDGSIRLSLPWYVPRSKGISFVMAKQEWLKKHSYNRPAITKEDEVNLRKMTERYLVPRLQKLADMHSIKINDIKVKKIRSRWGSCDQNKNITISLYLAQLPTDLSDYVFCHELAHISHMNHSPSFWQEVEFMLPDYKDRRKALKKFNPGRVV